MSSCPVPASFPVFQPLPLKPFIYVCRKGCSYRWKRHGQPDCPLQSICSPERKVSTTFCWQLTCHSLLWFAWSHTWHIYPSRYRLLCLSAGHTSYSTQYEANLALWLQDQIWFVSGWWGAQVGKEWVERYASVVPSVTMLMVEVRLCRK